MADVSLNTLKLLAAAVWYSGGIVLLFKGGGMLVEAEKLVPNESWFWYAIILGGCIGILKIMFIFRRVCYKNLRRINDLEKPKLWQFYRMGFFVFLLCMIALGSTLSYAAQGNYPFMIGMAILDFSLAVALLGSSYIFWKHRFD